MIAKGNGAHNRLARQRTTAPAESVIQSLDPQDGPRSTALRRGRLLGCHQSTGHLFVAEGLLLLLGLKPDLLTETVENLLQGHRTKSQRSQKVFRGDDIAALGHPHHGVAVQEQIEAITTEFPLQQIFAPLDRFITMAALVPLADPIARGGRRNEIEPIQAGVRCLTG